MLVLSRKSKQSIHIGNDIIVTVQSIHGNKVKLSIEAPVAVPVHRSELIEVSQGPPDSSLPLPASPPTVATVTQPEAAMSLRPRPPTGEVAPI